MTGILPSPLQVSVYLSQQQITEVGSVIIPTLQTGKLRQWVVTYFEGGTVMIQTQAVWPHHLSSEALD